ncbi:hypothetical protein GN956_G19423 [Arapaima gigas]
MYAQRCTSSVWTPECISETLCSSVDLQGTSHLQHMSRCQSESGDPPPEDQLRRSRETGTGQDWREFPWRTLELFDKCLKILFIV